jgi:hypothetical protein
MSEQEIIQRIKKLVEEDLPNLPPHIREWTIEHLVKPRQVDLSLESNGEGIIKLWLVTDHVGKNDASCRVVFDNEKGWFGLEMTLVNGVNWFMGFYGDFTEAVNGI